MGTAVQLVVRPRRLKGFVLVCSCERSVAASKSSNPIDIKSYFMML